jgi:5'-nucleotidase
MSSSAGGGSTKQLRLIHFNDVYEIEARKSGEPLGGAARLCGAIRSLRSESEWPSLVLFGGDIFSPSTMSILDKGRAMTDVINEIGVDACVIGNHDLDFGEPTLARWIGLTKTTWLLANMDNATTKQPLGGALRSVVLECAGVRVGVIGLAEEDWLKTLTNPPPIVYHDFVRVGDELARQLRHEQRVDLVVALVHMRLPNTVLLAEQMRDVDVVLGGHDHFIHKSVVRGRPVMISDNDFRAVGVVDLHLNDKRRVLSHDMRHIVLNSSIAEDPAMAALVKSLVSQSAGKLKKRIGWTSVPLDCTVKACRSSESNFGNLLADLCRVALGCDVCLFNGGTIRSDSVVPAGPFTLGDLLRVLPFNDPIVAISITGATLLNALEAGVSKYPTLDGCWPQVSGVRITVDPTQPPGARIISARFSHPDREIVPTETYSLATKAFLADGNDGYSMLKGSHYLVDEEAAQFLKQHVRSHLRVLETLNGWKCSMHRTPGQPHFGVRRAIAKFKVFGARNHSRSQSEQTQHDATAAPAVESREACPVMSLSPSVDGRVTVLTADAACDAAAIAAAMHEFEHATHDELVREIVALRSKIKENNNK